MTQRKKLIEVALPLEAINVASAREKSIRHDQPGTLPYQDERPAHITRCSSKKNSCPLEW
jgi:hypothetical protein